MNPYGQSYSHYNIQSYGNASRGDSFHWRSKCLLSCAGFVSRCSARDCSTVEQGKSFKLQVNKADSNTPGMDMDLDMDRVEL